MSAQLIDGKLIAQQLRADMKEEVARLTAAGNRPGLAVILVGSDPASQVYVNNKIKTCEQLGIFSEAIRLPEETSQEVLLQHIATLNDDERIHGILVQFPLPPHISEQAVIDALDPAKDVDGFHPINVGNLAIGNEGMLSCTPAGIIVLLKRMGIDIAGKHAVVVGRSNLVGKPLSLLLLRENATVTICHSRTQRLSEMTSQADILIAAVGRAQMIGKEHVKPGAIVIDVGMNRLANRKLVGDVDFDSVKEVASYITPVPGGVGPMTIAMLMSNTIKAAGKGSAR